VLSEVAVAADLDDATQLQLLVQEEVEVPEVLWLLAHFVHQISVRQRLLLLALQRREA
jgi:hypothetical protein